MTNENSSKISYVSGSSAPVSSGVSISDQHAPYAHTGVSQPATTNVRSAEYRLSIQDAISVLLSVQLTDNKTVQSILQKAIESKGTPGAVEHRIRDAIKGGKDIGDYVKDVDQYAQDKLLFTALVEQKYPGITEVIKKFGEERNIRTTEKGTEVTLGNGQVLRAEKSCDVVLPNTSFRAALLSSKDIDAFAKQGYASPLIIDTSQQNRELMESSLPLIPETFVPPLQVEEIAQLVHSGIDPMTLGLGHEHPFRGLEDAEPKPTVAGEDKQVEGTVDLLMKRFKE